MKSVEMYFNDTIAKYSLFKQAATLLIKEIPALSPLDISNRCGNLTTMHKELNEGRDQLFILMEFVGSTILDTSYVGEFQRALDKSIVACDLLHDELTFYQNSLLVRSE